MADHACEQHAACGNEVLLPTGDGPVSLPFLPYTPAPAAYKRPLLLQCISTGRRLSCGPPGAHVGNPGTQRAAFVFADCPVTPPPPPPCRPRSQVPAECRAFIPDWAPGAHDDSAHESAIRRASPLASEAQCACGYACVRIPPLSAATPAPLHASGKLPMFGRYPCFTATPRCLAAAGCPPTARRRGALSVDVPCRAPTCADAAQPATARKFDKRVAPHARSGVGDALPRSTHVHSLPMPPLYPATVPSPYSILRCILPHLLRCATPLTHWTSQRPGSVSITDLHPACCPPSLYNPTAWTVQFHTRAPAEQQQSNHITRGWLDKVAREGGRRQGAVRKARAGRVG